MKTILIVEDDPTSMKLFRNLLEGEGYAIRSAGDGNQALDQMEKEKPDMVLMDIQLPGVSGIEVYRLMQQRDELCDIPVVAISAFALAGDRERILEIGFDTFIAKPISLPNFRNIIGSIIENAPLDG